MDWANEHKRMLAKRIRAEAIDEYVRDRYGNRVDSGFGYALRKSVSSRRIVAALCYLAMVLLAALSWWYFHGLLVERAMG
jgi:hypothetical protein